MTRTRHVPVDPPRFGRDTLACSRVVNLSDAVFAIAMTLLVLTLDVPLTELHRLGAALLDQLPQFVAFALSFALVANLWWQHHRMLDLLDALEPGVIGINLILLAFVALVPFPTSLLGVAPGDPVAVIGFLAVFVVLTLLHLALLARAGVRGLISGDVPRERYIGLLAGYAVGVLVLLVAIAIAFWSTAAALAMVGASIVLGPVGARRPERFLRVDAPAPSTAAKRRPRKGATR